MHLSINDLDCKTSTGLNDMYNGSFHVVERTRTDANYSKKKARAKRAELSHCSICKFVTFLMLCSWWLPKEPLTKNIENPTTESNFHISLFST